MRMVWLPPICWNQLGDYGSEGWNVNAEVAKIEILIRKRYDLTKHIFSTEGQL